MRGVPQALYLENFIALRTYYSQMIQMPLGCKLNNARSAQVVY